MRATVNKWTLRLHGIEDIDKYNENAKRYKYNVKKIVVAIDAFLLVYNVIYVLIYYHGTNEFYSKLRVALISDGLVFSTSVAFYIVLPKLNLIFKGMCYIPMMVAMTLITEFNIVNYPFQDICS